MLELDVAGALSSEKKNKEKCLNYSIAFLLLLLTLHLKVVQSSSIFLFLKEKMTIKSFQFSTKHPRIEGIYFNSYTPKA